MTIFSHQYFKNVKFHTGTAAPQIVQQFVFAPGTDLVSVVHIYVLIPKPLPVAGQTF